MKESAISFLVTKEELELLEKVLFLEPGLIDGVEGAKKEKDKFRVKFAIADLEDALQALSYFAQSMAGPEERIKFYRLSKRIEGYLSLRQKFRAFLLKKNKKFFKE
jgi:hypothetical protein